MITHPFNRGEDQICYGTIISIKVVAHINFDATFEASGHSQVFVDAYPYYVSGLSCIDFVMSSAFDQIYYSF